MSSLAKGIVNRSKLILVKPKPQEVHRVGFAVTYLCNGRCKTCNIWKKYKDNPHASNTELKLEEIKSIFSKSKYLANLRQIDLTGGEPFLRKDFVELCCFFMGRYPDINIATGTNSVSPRLVTNKLAQINRDCKARSILISPSLDGLGKTHDEARGTPGTYERVISLLQLIKTQLPMIKPGLSFTITPDNYKELLDVYTLAEKMDATLGFNFAQTSGLYYGNSEMQFQWNDADLNEVKKTIDVIIKRSSKRKDLLSRLAEVDAYYMANMVKFQKRRSRIHECYAGTESLFLDPYGNVFPCIMLDQKMGNLRESSFDEIWMSPRAQRIREFIRQKKCSCWTVCEAYSSLVRNPRVILWNLARLLRG